MFHTECLFTYVKYQINQKTFTIACPLCRDEIITVNPPQQTAIVVNMPQEEAHDAGIYSSMYSCLIVWGSVLVMWTVYFTYPIWL
jgi:hypothetical protein